MGKREVEAGGYCDQSHLVRDFRAMTGLTPGQYHPVAADTPNHVAVDQAKFINTELVRRDILDASYEQKGSHD